MRAKGMIALSVAVLLAAAAAPAAAGHHEEAKAEAEAEAHAHHENGAYVRNLDFVGGRAVDLATAIPEEAYGWRPMEGVRSVSESIMHMANANYFFASRLGTPTPDEVEGKNLEEITEKDQCVAILEKSIGHLAKALGSVEDTEAEMEIFGRDGTAEDMMQIAIGHVHEHFGQLIAYARSNRVVPPWSQ